MAVNKFYGFCMAVISSLIFLKILYWNTGLQLTGLQDLSGVLSAGELSPNEISIHGVIPIPFLDLPPPPPPPLMPTPI